MTLLRSRSSASGGRFDAEEIRRLVNAGKAQGMIRSPGEAVVIEKNGFLAANNGGVRTVWMDVPPPLAAKWLENNFRNRPVKHDVVEAYARDMINGVWVPTHQGVAFNDRDELIDGQHRLMAIVMSGCTIRMMVTFGLKSAIDGKEMTTMDAVDRGRTRSVADQLTIQHGFKNSSITASICSSISGICCSARTRRLSVGQTLEIFRAFENPIEWVIIHRSKDNGIRAAGVLAAFSFALQTEDGFFGCATPIAAMFQYLTTGKGIKPGAPICHLRKFLLSDDAKLLTRGSDRGVAELTLQAIYLQIQDKRIDLLKMGQEGADHFRGKQKDRVNKIAEMFQLPKNESTGPASKSSPRLPTDGSTASDA